MSSKPPSRPSRPPASSSSPSPLPTTILAGSTGLSFLSRWFFGWLFPVLVGDTLLATTDCLVLQRSERAEFVGNKMEQGWEDERARNKG
ncbi:hypothetical protein BC937DRAFT_90333 [Endogone sp. FLAS-F59071]|nr:hypothetical protein BC937DRAFT_90333 [Endogone sp. FLAS-F59071]|eukprot:RUS17154.1 hypothetical protein BC937DRAFT_90333 [Endogone sp. FLAS-F59071]